MDIKRALPCPELRSVVRSFEERRADLGSAVLSWPVAARPFPERQNSAVVGGPALLRGRHTGRLTGPFSLSTVRHARFHRARARRARGRPAAVRVGCRKLFDLKLPAAAALALYSGHRVSRLGPATSPRTRPR